MAIAEAMIRIDAVTAADIRNQLVDLIAGGKDVDSLAARVRSLKAANSAASTRAGAASLAISATTARVPATRIRSAANREAQPVQILACAKLTSRAPASISLFPTGPSKGHLN